MAKKLTPNKAREILHDKSVHGHPLTDAQRRFFGAMSKGNTIKYQGGGEVSPMDYVLNNIVTNTSIPNAPFNYNDYYNKADKYLSRDVFKGTQLHAKDIAESARDFYNKTGYTYPLDLLLTQGQMETKLGKTLKSKNNFFNVGNTDAGDFKEYASPKESIMNYMDTMYDNYLYSGNRSVDDLLKPKNFINSSNQRYASDPDYEKKLATQRDFIKKKIYKGGGWLEQYKDGGAGPIRKAYGDYVDENYNYATGSAPQGYIGGGYETSHRNYSPAWGGQFAMGGSLPGATGMMYAREGAPSNGKYAKKTLPSARDGQMMSDYYIHGNDFKTKGMKEGGWLDKYNTPQAQTGYSDSFNIPKVTQDRDVTDASRVVKYDPLTKKVQGVQTQSADALKAQQEQMKANAEDKLAIASKQARREQDAWKKSKQILNGQYTSDDYLSGPDKRRDLMQAFAPIANMYDTGITPIDVLNPVSWGAGMVADVTSAPYQARETNSIKPYIYAAAQPIIGSVIPALPEITSALKNPIKSLINEVDNKFITPIQFKNQISQIKDLNSNLLNTLNQPEAASRLEELGVNFPSMMSQPTLTFKSGMKSSYWPLMDHINMDMREIAKLQKQGYDLVPETVYEHEVGHKIQKEVNDSRIRTNLMNNSKNQVNDFINQNLPTSTPTNLDLYAKNLKPYSDLTEFGKNSLNYFNNEEGVEPLAHFREMRQNMINAGIIKDPYEPITHEHIAQFLDDNIGKKPQDRIASFVDPNRGNNMKMLTYIMNKLPTVTSVVGGVGTAESVINNNVPEQKKQGGVIKDDMGYWNPENWGKVVEIGSNDITMQGVNQPLLGISDEGDTKYMEPGKDYKFKGKKVKEYPIAQNGSKQDKGQLVKLDQLTNFTNYNKPEKGGWLEKYN